MDDPSPRLHPAILANLGMALLVGSVFRTFRLAEQALTGDEWHTLRAAAELGTWNLLTAVQSGAHYSVPEALFFKALSSVTSVSELVIYVPYVLVGLATVVIAPLTLGKRIAGALTVLPWLIAVSPTFVFYSRYARPYGPVAVFSLLALLAFARWEQERSRSSLLTYSCFATLASYFHVVALPFVFAPLLLRGLHELRIRRIPFDTLRAGAVAATPTLILVGLPLLRTSIAVTEKMGQAQLSPRSILSGLAVCIGSPEPWIALVLLAFASIGATVFVRNDAMRPLMIQLGFASIVQLFAILLARPVAVQGPHIFARYAIQVSLVALILVSAGIDWAARTAVSSRLGRSMIVALIVVGFATPTTIRAMRGSGSQPQLSLLAYLIWGANAESTITEGLTSRTQEIYQRLADIEPSSVSLLEMPYKANDYYLQTREMVHHQKVLFGYTTGWCSRPLSTKGAIDLGPAISRLALRHTLLVRSADLPAERFDFAILHRDLASETSYQPDFGEYDVSACSTAFVAQFGTPVYDKDGVVVFATSEKGWEYTRRLGFGDGTPHDGPPPR